MKCPACQNTMIVIEYQAIELDYCVNCRGTWFDSGELELLFQAIKREATGVSPGTIPEPTETKSTEKKRRCPRCGKKMRKSSIGTEPKVLIDACPRGEGLWFDGGEIEQLVTRLIAKPLAKTDSQEQIIAFLGEVFRGGK